MTELKQILLKLPEILQGCKLEGWAGSSWAAPAGASENWSQILYPRRGGGGAERGQTYLQWRVAILLFPHLPKPTAKRHCSVHNRCLTWSGPLLIVP